MNNKRYQFVLPIPARTPALKRQSGFSLLEVLIAVVILSVGLLGLAGMQVTSLKYVTSSLQRTQATSLAYDILDRIRVNPDGNYITPLTAAASTFQGTTSSLSGSNDDCLDNDGSVTCTAAQMANFDLSEWKTAIEDLLPGGQGSVSLTGSTIIISVAWQDKRVEQGLTAAQRILSVDLRSDL